MLLSSAPSSFAVLAHCQDIHSVRIGAPRIRCMPASCLLLAHRFHSSVGILVMTLGRSRFPHQAPRPAEAPMKNRQSTRGQELSPNGRNLCYLTAKPCSMDQIIYVHTSQMKVKGRPSKDTFDLHGALPTTNTTYKAVVVVQDY